MDNGLDGLMKQAKEMQEKMERFRSEASNSEVTGESGAGLVSVRTVSYTHLTLPTKRIV